MDKTSQLFLEKLLKTPAPSGHEESFQKIWLDYMKDYAQKVYSDTAGNGIAVLNEESNVKIMFAGHADEISFIINYIDESGFIYVKTLGGINPKLALGKRVRVLGKKTLIGTVGVKAQHQGGPNDELKVKDIFIDVGATSKEDLTELVNIGDIVIYDVSFDYSMNDTIIARGLDNKTGAFIVAEALKRLSEKDLKVALYAVSTVSEETIKNGAYFAGSQIKPDMALACDVTFATDYPGLDKKEHGDVKLAGGPVISMGAPINKKINELLKKAAEQSKINLQYELTPRRTGTDADQIRVTGDGVPVALVSLPLRYMHSPSEMVSLKDIEAEIELLVNFVELLNESTSFKPMEKYGY